MVCVMFHVMAVMCGRQDGKEDGAVRHVAHHAEIDGRLTDENFVLELE